MKLTLEIQGNRTMINETAVEVQKEQKPVNETEVRNVTTIDNQIKVPKGVVEVVTRVQNTVIIGIKQQLDAAK